MGNTVVLEAGLDRRLLDVPPDQAARGGGPAPGVINLVLGSGATVGDAALAQPDLAGIHFTGSTAVFQGMWRTRRREHRELPLLPADRRRDRRQGLHRRPPVGRSGRRRDRDRARRRSSTRARSARPRPASTRRPTCGRRSASALERDVPAIRIGRRARLPQLHGRGDRRERRSPRRRRRSRWPAPATTPRSSSAATPTTARATSSARPWSSTTDPSLRPDAARSCSGRS